MNSVNRRETIRLILIICWLVFTVSFAIWWFTLSSGHISLLKELQPEQSEHWLRQKRMLFWEGWAWIALLALGAGALIALVQKEKSRVRKIKEFFASFSHEVKTSLASLRLQAEALKDESTTESPILDRLIGDTVRLQVQLENSLFFASQDNLQLFVEPLQLSAVVERMREQWPTLKIDLDQDVIVRADDRAMRTILSNLLQNALVHGQATHVRVGAESLDGGRVRLTISDDGQGFQGDAHQLGRLFHRPTPTSGSGLGLYICKMLVGRMDGEFGAESARPGFRVVMTLPGDGT